MDVDFATDCPLVRPALPRIRFLFVRSRFRSTLPSDGLSRFLPCASLVLHLHQVAQGTFTPRLLGMPSTQPKPPAAVASRGLTPLPRPKRDSGSVSGTNQMPVWCRAAGRVWGKEGCAPLRPNRQPGPVLQHEVTARAGGDRGGRGSSRRRPVSSRGNDTRSRVTFRREATRGGSF
jgi:hypothetical protein